MRPNNRSSFKEYILRKNGHPVVQINVSDEQIEDRIDEALSFFSDYHYNGSEQIYLKHQVTETDKINKYISLPERILGISRVFNMGTGLGSGMWNANYQFVLNNLQDITGYSVVNYYMTMQHISLLQEVLSGSPIVRYNRHVNRLHIDINWDKVAVGSWIVVEAYDILDENMYTDLWNDRWLQNYAACLVREQWGVNLSKFTGVQLMGGVQFNSEMILQEARETRQRLEEEAINSLQPLVYNFQG